MSKIRIGVYGASGYAGMDLIEILAQHPHAEIVFATSSTFAGQDVPSTKLRYLPPDDAALGTVDVAFLALPHGVSAKVAAKALAAGVRVLDLSADLRLKTPEAYQQWYGHQHPHPELLPTPYGLPEIHRTKITTDTQVVAVPGCYPTATLLGLLPLLQNDWIAANSPIIVDAKSGVSGAGREPKQNTHFVEVYSNLSPYSVGRSHRHVGEIEQEIHILAPDAGTLIFTPHLLPVDRGLMSSVYVTLKDEYHAAEAQGLYEQAYCNELLVNVLPNKQLATLRHAVHTNQCVISLTPVGERYLHVTSVIDNLRKGASGQAVQCFNLMFGFAETMALL